MHLLHKDQLPTSQLAMALTDELVHGRFHEFSSSLDIAAATVTAVNCMTYDERAEVDSDDASA